MCAEAVGGTLVLFPDRSSRTKQGIVLCLSQWESHALFLSQDRVVTTKGRDGPTAKQWKKIGLNPSELMLTELNLEQMIL